MYLIGKNPVQPDSLPTLPARTHAINALRLTVMIATLPLILSGCTWFDGGDSTAVSTSKPTAQPQTTYTTKSTTATVQAQDWTPGTTLADQRLERIYNQQQAILKQLQERPDDFTQPERDRLLDNLLSQYQAFTHDNPNFVYGYILYGKLLRLVGDRDAANIAFAKANQLDPEIAVVKQQIGNYFAEEGNVLHAIPYFIAAVDLEPNNALYHYQLGELLYQGRDQLIETNDMTRRIIDMEMLEAFSNAARLDADNRIFLKRYAEAFFDVDEPDWQAAANIWYYLENTSDNDVERDIIRIQYARVLISMGETDKARKLLNAINRPSLEEHRQQLLSQITSHENP